MPLTRQTGIVQTAAAALLAFGMAGTVGTALAFEHIGGFIPCALCLGQRVPYYIGAPVMALALVSALAKWPALVTRGLLVAGGLLMVWSLYMAAYHAGVEWGWWPGPGDCGVAVAPVDTGGLGILDAIDRYVPPSCDVASGRFMGLSFAGWNVLSSLGLGAVAFYAAFARASLPFPFLQGSSSTSQ